MVLLYLLFFHIFKSFVFALASYEHLPLLSRRILFASFFSFPSLLVLDKGANFPVCHLSSLYELVVILVISCVTRFSIILPKLFFQTIFFYSYHLTLLQSTYLHIFLLFHLISLCVLCSSFLSKHSVNASVMMYILGAEQR